MRYWVYQDSRIHGPFTREELPSVPEVHSGTLVCPESAGGIEEVDWVPLGSKDELSTVFSESRRGSSALVSAPGKRPNRPGCWQVRGARGPRRPLCWLEKTAAG